MTAPAARIVAAVMAVLLVTGLDVALYVNQHKAPDATRRVLCHGVLNNMTNEARFDPEVIALCAEVGVYPNPK